MGHYQLIMFIFVWSCPDLKVFWKEIHAIIQDILELEIEDMGFILYLGFFAITHLWLQQIAKGKYNRNRLWQRYSIWKHWYLNWDCKERLLKVKTKWGETHLFMNGGRDYVYSYLSNTCMNIWIHFDW